MHYPAKSCLYFLFLQFMPEYFWTFERGSDNLANFNVAIALRYVQPRALFPTLCFKFLYKVRSSIVLLLELVVFALFRPLLIILNGKN